MHQQYKAVRIIFRRLEQMTLDFKVNFVPNLNQYFHKPNHALFLPEDNQILQQFCAWTKHGRAHMVWAFVGEAQGGDALSSVCDESGLCMDKKNPVDTASEVGPCSFPWKLLSGA